MTPPASNRGSLWKGIVIGAALTVAALLFLYWLSSMPNVPGTSRYGSSAIVFIAVFYIGGVQVLWMLPAALVFRAKKQTKSAKGILIAADLVFLLNAAIFGLFMFGVLRFPGP